MNLWLVVPVKPFLEGKSRLDVVLAPAQRIALNRHLLMSTLRTVQASGLFAGMAVVSRDAAVLGLAARLGAEPIVETSSDLNAALDQARLHVEGVGAAALLVLPADLPLLTVADVEQLVVLGEEADVVLARSRDGGTNALWLRLPPPIAFAFGPGSYERHRQQALTAGCRVAIYRSTSIALDLDWPEDWELLTSLGALRTSHDWAQHAADAR